MARKASSPYVHGLNGEPLVSPSGHPLKRVSHDSGAPYNAGASTRRTRGWIATGSGPTATAVADVNNLRNRSREQYRNNPFAQSAINRLVSNIVGTGIRPRSQADSEQVRQAIQALWAKWVPWADPEGLLDFYGLQAQAANTWLQAGECFVRYRPRRASDRLPVSMQVQVMEPEMCPVTYSVLGTNGNPIRHGIEFDRVGRRVAYWFYRNHPGEGVYWRRPGAQELVRVPAREVSHLFDPVRPGQIRGIVKMAPVLVRLHEIDKFDDATLLRQQIANLFAAFIKRRPDDEVASPISMTGDALDEDDEGPSVGLEPGLVQELEEGEEMQFSDPPDVGNVYGDFLYRQLSAIAVGMDMPYEVMTGDFSKINDRTARVVLNDFRRRVQQFQQHIMAHQLCRRAFDFWVRRAILDGTLPAAGFAQDPDTLLRVKWIPQAWAYIHPLQDAQAFKQLRLSGFKTAEQIISETTGEDIDDVYDQLEKENRMAEERDLTLDSITPSASSSGGSPGAIANDDADGADTGEGQGDMDPGSS